MPYNHHIYADEMDLDWRHVLIDITKLNQISIIRNIANTGLKYIKEISNKKIADHWINIKWRTKPINVRDMLNKQ